MLDHFRMVRNEEVRRGVAVAMREKMQKIFQLATVKALEMEKTGEQEALSDVVFNGVRVQDTLDDKELYAMCFVGIQKNDLLSRVLHEDAHVLVKIDTFDRPTNLLLSERRYGINRLGIVYRFEPDEGLNDNFHRIALQLPEDSKEFQLVSDAAHTALKTLYPN